MTLKDVIMEYGKKNNLTYLNDDDSLSDEQKNACNNYYGDMRNRLVSCFECLGLFDYSVLKEGKHTFDFSEKQKLYIFYLLDQFDSDFFKARRTKEFELKYVRKFVDEIEKLLCFVKSYVKSEETCMEISVDIMRCTNYVMFKRYAQKEYLFNDFYVCVNNLILNDKFDSEIVYFEYLKETDKEKLFDELINFIDAWIKLFDSACEYRNDENIDFVFNCKPDYKEYKDFTIVEAEIDFEFSSKVEQMVKKLESKPKSKLMGRNLNREKKMNKELKKIRSDLEKEACEKHGISYDNYLSQKEYMRPQEFDFKTTEEVFEILKKEI